MPLDSYPDANSEVEKKVGRNDNDVWEAERLRQGVEADGGVRHPERSRHCRKVPCGHTHLSASAIRFSSDAGTLQTP